MSNTLKIPFPKKEDFYKAIEEHGEYVQYRNKTPKIETFKISVNQKGLSPYFTLEFILDNGKTFDADNAFATLEFLDETPFGIEMELVYTVTPPTFEKFLGTLND